MLRGEVPTTTIGVVVFVFSIITVSFFIGSTFMRVRSELATAQESIDVVDMAHLVKRCLERGGRIDTDFLETNNDRSFKLVAEELPEICRDRDVSVRVSDAEAGTEWSFGTGKGTAHSVFVSLKVGEEIHFGELYVSV